MEEDGLSSGDQAEEGEQAQLYPRETYPTRLRRALLMDKVVLRESAFWGKSSIITRAEGHAIVMVSMTANEETVAVLHDIVVDKRIRGIGVGGILLDDACEEAEAMGASTLRLAVEPGSWQEGWYSRNGFDAVGETALDGHVCVVMEKAIRRDAVEPPLP